jgi:galactitol-specific phosphotransferase system IIB component
LKIIGTSTVNQIYLDKFLKNYQVTLDGDIITEILIDSNGKFIDIGVYINDLLKAIAQNQTTAVNMATQPVTNSSLDFLSVLARNSAQLENVTSVTETLSNFTI